MNILLSAGKIKVRRLLNHKKAFWPKKEPDKQNKNLAIKINQNSLFFISNNCINNYKFF